MLRTKASSVSKVKRLHERASERLRAPDSNRLLWELEPSKGLSAPLLVAVWGVSAAVAVAGPPDSVALWMGERMPATASRNAGEVVVVPLASRPSDPNGDHMLRRGDRP